LIVSVDWTFPIDSFIIFTLLEDDSVSLLYNNFLLLFLPFWESYSISYHILLPGNFLRFCILCIDFIVFFMQSSYLLWLIHYY
jgi:hypothetical protein